MNYLGLDYGAAHIGVALATGPLAEPLATLNTNTCISELEILISQHNIKGIIIGNAASDFLNQLAIFNLPIHQTDETLSSQDAVKSLLHTTQSRRQQLEHSAAAAIILQSWLDSKPFTL